MKCKPHGREKCSICEMDEYNYWWHKRPDSSEPNYIGLLLTALGLFGLIVWIIFEHWI